MKSRLASAAIGALAAWTSANMAACKRDPGTTGGGGPSVTSTNAPNAPPLPPVFGQPTVEQTSRKARSEAVLAAARVKVSATLPVIAGESQATVRTQDQVVDRAVALLIVALKGEGLSQAAVDRVRSDYGADALFSPKEKAFIVDTAPSQQDRTDFVWRYECLNVLQWALGFTEELAPPSDLIDVHATVKVIKDRGVGAYRAAARLRPPAAILDAADLIYRYDWACVDARVGHGPPPAGINCEVVVERHRALNWLYGYQGQAWDHVSTDT